MNEISDLFRIEYQLNGYGRSLPTYAVDIKCVNDSCHKTLVSTYRKNNNLPDAEIVIVGWQPHFVSGKNDHLDNTASFEVSNYCK